MIETHIQRLIRIIESDNLELIRDDIIKALIEEWIDGHLLSLEIKELKGVDESLINKYKQQHACFIGLLSGLIKHEVINNELRRCTH